MALPLTTYAFKLSPTFKGPLVDVPVLVWTTADSNSDGKASVTKTSIRVTRPTTRDPIIFELRKGQRPGGNPFTMGITLGRTDANDLSVNDSSVSRFHAYFKEQQGQWFLVDAESKNGTWAGPLKLSPKTPAALSDGMMLRFGDVRVQFMTPASFAVFVSARLK